MVRLTVTRRAGSCLRYRQAVGGAVNSKVLHKPCLNQHGYPPRRRVEFKTRKSIEREATQEFEQVYSRYRWNIRLSRSQKVGTEVRHATLCILLSFGLFTANMSEQSIKS